MNKRMLILAVAGVGVALVAGAAASSAASGRTHKVDMDLVGSIIGVDDGVSLFDVTVRGAPGPASMRGLAYTEVVPFDQLPGGTPCIDIGPPVAGLIITQAQLTAFFSDGSMLFGKLAEDADNYACFAPGFAHVEYDVVGGTRRYEGAAGRLLFDIDTFVIEQGAVVTPEDGSVGGEIHLP